MRWFCEQRLFFAGTALIESFDWMMFVFGGFLIITSLRAAFHEEEEIHLEHNPLLKAVRKVLPVSKDYDGQKMITRADAKLAVTPLMVVLILIESTDILFRRGFCAGHPRRQPGPLRGAELERIRDSRVAFDVFPFSKVHAVTSRAPQQKGWAQSCSLGSKWCCPGSTRSARPYPLR